MKSKAGREDPPSIAEDILSAKWNLSIMRVLGDGPARFSGIRAAIPAVSANILARRLRELEEAGIISRRALPPPADCRVYELTSLGEAARRSSGQSIYGNRYFSSWGRLEQIRKTICRKMVGLSSEAIRQPSARTLTMDTSISERLKGLLWPSPFIV
ncbi:helix-turn-helix transcriptional regulator [Novosphingobium sp. YJ-S2-02]|uniref:Helix-turn-helix transcriptional regulator n=1 Tax=Novosphingobium aureum TaxID=2792964 RepID=A0A931HGX9_9SPHN|nr:helix-turn-helix transcriptional regulator [Novosphingobium aureum]